MSERLPDCCYGDSNASIYDQLYPLLDPGCLSEVARPAGSCRVLELGVGTGRGRRSISIFRKTHRGEASA